MDLFFQSEMLIFFGGIAAVLLFRQFSMMKVVSVLSICIGSLLGLYSSLSMLNGETALASFKYLNAFSLSFRGGWALCFFPDGYFYCFLFSYFIQLPLYEQL